MRAFLYMSVCMHACACVHEYYSVNVCRITALIREFGTGQPTVHVLWWCFSLLLSHCRYAVLQLS